MKMRMRRNFILLSALVMLAASVWPVASMDKDATCQLERASAVVDERASATKGKSVHQWIEQMGDNDFRQRDEASRELRKLGAAALPNLKEALHHRDTEIRQRAEQLIELIEAQEKMPCACIEGIPLMSGLPLDALLPAAVQVEDVKLPLPDQIPHMPQVPVLPVLDNIQLVCPSTCKSARIIEEANGNRIIITDIFSDNKWYSVVIEKSQQCIHVAVTETRDGKEVKNEYRGKNAEELKKKHPEVNKIFKEIKAKEWFRCTEMKENSCCPAK